MERRAKSDDSEKKSAARPVYWRRDGAGKRIPEDEEAAVNLIELTPGSDEYESVATRVLTRGLPDARIARVRRCVNGGLWAPYAQRRKEMAARAGGAEGAAFPQDVLPGVEAENGAPVCGAENPCRERYLFHGASPGTIDTILESGVDFRLSPTHMPGARAVPTAIATLPTAAAVGNCNFVITYPNIFELQFWGDADRKVSGSLTGTWMMGGRVRS